MALAKNAFTRASAAGSSAGLALVWLTYGRGPGFRAVTITGQAIAALRPSCRRFRGGLAVTIIGIGM
jgi:hypothetical protein